MEQKNIDENIIDKNFPKEISEKVIAMIDIPEIREGLKKEGRFEKKYGPFAAGQEAMCALFILSDDKTRETGEDSTAKLITNDDGTCYINFNISIKKTSLTDKEKAEIASHNKMWFGQGEDIPSDINSSSKSSEVVLSASEMAHLAGRLDEIRKHEAKSIPLSTEKQYIENLKNGFKYDDITVGKDGIYVSGRPYTKITEEPKLSDNTKKMVEDAIKINPGDSKIEESAPWKTIRLGDKVVDPRYSDEIISPLDNETLQRLRDNASNTHTDTHTESTSTDIINETTGEYSDDSSTQPENDNNVTTSDNYDDASPRRGGK